MPVALWILLSGVLGETTVPQCGTRGGRNGVPGQELWRPGNRLF